MNRLIVFAAVLMSLTSIIAVAQDCKRGEVQVQITDLQLTGATTLDPALKQNIVDTLKRQIADACQLPDEFRERVDNVLKSYGYMQSLVDEPKWKQVGGDEKRQSLEVSVDIKEGPVFRLGSIQFSGAKEYSPAELRAAFPSADGTIVDVRNIRAGLKNVQQLYCSRGYINATSVPEMDLDNAKTILNLKVAIDEGVQYRVGKLILNGVEPNFGAAQKLRNAWKPNEGQIYSCTTWEKAWPKFLQDAPRIGDFRTSTRGPINDLPKLIHHEDTKTVDFVYEFPWLRPY